MTNDLEIVQAEVVARGNENLVVKAEVVSENSHPQIGQPCPACGAPREGLSKFCVACGTPLETPAIPLVVAGASGSSVNAIPDHAFQCKSCGSEVNTSVEQRSYVCPFCDSSYVVELPKERGRQRPEFIIGFAVTAVDAKQLFFDWLKNNSWFRPGDLAQRAIAEKQRGVYLPFWHFSMHAHSHWSANIGEYWYRTETYTTRDANGKTVTRTRQVRETEWFPLRGRYHRYYFGYLVPASKGISHAEARDIQPFQLSALARYRPYFLAGWMAEEYSISMDLALEQCKAEFERRQQNEVHRFLPGDTSSGLSVSTQFEVGGSDLILLPVHVLSYRYRDKLYHFLVNGQTGKVVGTKPVSAARVTTAVLAAVLFIFALFVLLLLLSR
jgi:hypothetical protein